MKLNFRAWLKNEKKMVIVETIDFTGEYILYKGQTEERVFRFKDIVLMQDTGLIDKNGNSLYEGDIITFEEKEWGSIYKEIISFDYELLSLRENDYKNFCEIIGNVFENDILLDTSKLISDYSKFLKRC